MEILFTTLNRNIDIDLNSAKTILKLKGFKKQFNFEDEDDCHGGETFEVYSNVKFSELGIVASKFENPVSEITSEEDYIKFIEEVQKDLISYKLKNYQEATIGDVVGYIINCVKVNFLGHNFIDSSIVLKSLFDHEIEDEAESN